MEENREQTLTFVERWKEDPAQIIGGALGMSAFLAVPVSFIFGIVWGINKGSSIEQVFFTVVFGLSVIAVSFFPFALLQNSSINGAIRRRNDEADNKAAKKLADAERVAKKDAALLRVMRLTVLEWAVRHGQVDNVDGLAENLLVSLKAHREEVRAQRRSTAAVTLLQPNSTLPG